MNQNKKTPQVAEDIPNIHWADHVAEELIGKHPKKETLVCASGISPSGIVHIGNFREAITVDFVVRALLDRGKKVRFLYSWDDYDAFRKVPANMPADLEKQMRKPISSVTDPCGKHPSYAAHNEKTFEAEIEQLGLRPQYIYQNKAYRAGDYQEGIRHALRHQDKIVEILNRSRTEPLPKDWSCISIFCKTCERDMTELRKFTEPSTFEYHCDFCKKDDVIDMAKEGGVKLLWRVDWPMRWAKEEVDFEPGGKDHSSQGGSYDTGCEIIREVWKKEPPHYVQYDFVLVKGLGAKISSSSGNVITLDQLLAVYEPAVIRWIFASRKPNIDFSIAFDLDVMKAYDEFDRSERFAYGVEEGDAKKVSYERRIYEFSTTERHTGAYGKVPVQFPFRHLCNLLQIHQGNLEKAREDYELTDPGDVKRFEARAKRAWNWIQTYAPPDFKFALRTADNPPPKAKHPEAVKALLAVLADDTLTTEDALGNKIWDITKSQNLEAKAFFQDVYQALIAKNAGPKLASFLLAIGRKTAHEILSKAI